MESGPMMGQRFCAKKLNGEPACPSCTLLIRQTVVTSDWPEEFKALGGVN